MLAFAPARVGLQDLGMTELSTMIREHTRD
jgi:hypothetical protein